MNMSDTERIVSRTGLPATERRARSRLVQLLSQPRGILRGSLLVRQRVCGKPGCKCARGHKHESLYLVISDPGRTRQLYVPKDFEPLVRRWVEDYHQARDLLEEISRIHWDKVRNRQG
jgi:hypothetical protein